MCKLFKETDCFAELEFEVVKVQKLVNQRNFNYDLMPLRAPAHDVFNIAIKLCRKTQSNRN